MDVIAMGKESVSLCREGKNLEAIEQLYSPDIVSVEAAPMPGLQQIETRIEAIKAKNTWWIDNYEIYGREVLGPFPHGNRFIAHFSFEVTSKQSGQRMTMEEMGLHTVESGKVARGEFFYRMGE